MMLERVMNEERTMAEATAPVAIILFFCFIAMLVIVAYRAVFATPENSYFLEISIYMKILIGISCFVTCLAATVFKNIFGGFLSVLASILIGAAIALSSEVSNVGKFMFGIEFVICLTSIWLIVISSRYSFEENKAEGRSIL